MKPYTAQVKQEPSVPGRSCHKGYGATAAHLRASQAALRASANRGLHSVFLSCVEAAMSKDACGE